MAKAARPVPEGHQTIVPYLKVHGAAEAIDFYIRALGGQVLRRLTGVNGLVLHAELKIGDSVLYLSDEFGGEDGCAAPPGVATGCIIHLNVTDADIVWRSALGAGAVPLMPLADMFWGDRYGQFRDPFGHVWSVSTHKEDLTSEEIVKRSEAFLATMAEHRKS